MGQQGWYKSFVAPGRPTSPGAIPTTRNIGRVNVSRGWYHIFNVTGKNFRYANAEDAFRRSLGPGAGSPSAGRNKGPLALGVLSRRTLSVHRNKRNASASLSSRCRELHEPAESQVFRPSTERYLVAFEPPQIDERLQAIAAKWHLHLEYNQIAFDHAPVN